MRTSKVDDLETKGLLTRRESFVGGLALFSEFWYSYPSERAIRTFRFEIVDEGGQRCDEFLLFEVEAVVEPTVQDDVQTLRVLVQSLAQLGENRGNVGFRTSSE